MVPNDISRRRFLEGAAAVAGLTVVSPAGLHAAQEKKKRTAVDQVKLGNTGMKLSRLGIGVGSNSGNVQRSLGAEGFNKLVRYAYDQGITYIDTADSYKTHTWVREAIKGLPRETFFIQSKMGGNPEKPLEVLDRFRQELGMDYIDCVLTHCTVTPGWDEERKRVLDALEEAKAKKIIRAHGVSCHSLPALKRAVQIDWVDVHLVRVNPQGAHMDTMEENWNAKSDTSHVPAVMEQLRIMQQKKRGVIGMKIIGNGDFTNPEDREKSIRFAMRCRPLNAVVIGFKSPAEIDEAIQRMNNALAELA
ncbi:MAG: aldo/keto reductase [Sedimentisphaerales bacterium]|nr:aldo/keto reductase [Sedimentisphaerales bacterium]